MEKDLGMYIDCKLKFNKYHEIQVNIANKIPGVINRSFTFRDEGAIVMYIIDLTFFYIFY